MIPLTEAIHYILIFGFIRMITLFFAAWFAGIFKCCDSVQSVNIDTCGNRPVGQRSRISTVLQHYILSKSVCEGLPVTWQKVSKDLLKIHLPSKFDGEYADYHHNGVSQHPWFFGFVINALQYINAWTLSKFCRVSSKRRTKFVPNTSDPVWNQVVEYVVPFRELYSHYLEFTVWDYDKFSDNNSLGQVVISLSGNFFCHSTFFRTLMVSLTSL